MAAPQPTARPRRRPGQARGVARVDRIVDAAVELLAVGGGEALTTNAVARTAATSVGSIYEYFDAREAVAVAVADRLAARYEEAPLDVPTPSALAAVLVSRFVTWWDTTAAIGALWWQSATPLGAAGAQLRERVVAATARTIVTCTGADARTERCAAVVTSTVAGLLHGAGDGTDRDDVRRTASLTVGAYLAAALPVVAVPAGTSEPQQGVVDRPSAGRAGRALHGRQRMLDAAVDRLVVEGYAGATTVAIQAAAGVSRGRLLHQFPSRDLLLVAAVGHLADQRVRATQRRVVQIVQDDRSGPQRIDHVVELMWASYQEPHYWAASELWTAARTNPEIAGALRPHERRLGATIRAAVGEMFGPPYVDDARFAMLRDVLLTSMRGVAAAYAFERRDPASDPHLAMWRQLAHLVLAPVNSQP